MTPDRLRKKIAEKLLAQGWVADMDRFSPALGGTRTSYKGDYFRWEGWGHRVGQTVRYNFCCYDTMTTCARKDVVLIVSRDGEVSAQKVQIPPTSV